MPGALDALKKYAFGSSGGKDINLPLRPGEKPDPSIKKRQGAGTISNIVKGYGVAKEAAKRK